MSATTTDPTPVVEPWIAGVMTEADFERILDAHPARRRAFHGYTPQIQAWERARFARICALRTSPLPAELARVGKLAGELLDRVEGIVVGFAPLEGARVLKAHGLHVPGPGEFCTSNGGDHFAEALKACRRAARFLAAFVDVMRKGCGMLVPESDEGRAAA